MGKLDCFKYIAFSLILLVLILPQNNDAWIWTLGLVGALLIFWLFKNFKGLEFWKYSGILLAVPLLILDINSKAFSWLLSLSIIGVLVWTLKKFVFKND